MKKQQLPEEQRPPASRPQPGASPNDNSFVKSFEASQRASNEVARAQVSNQQGAGVQEWQTPLRPANTPNVQQGARSQQAINQGHSLHSSSPTETPRWVQPTPGAPAQETQQAGQALHKAGVKSDNAPLSDQTRAQMQAALDRNHQMGQNAGQEKESRLEAAAKERSNLPSAPSEDKQMQR